MIYESLKKAFLFFFPKKLLLKNEKLIRNIIYLYYKGNKHECNICQKKLRKFIELENGELICPNCGSMGRNRRFWQIIQSDLKDDISILDFSPSKCLYYKFKGLKNINYVSTDYANEFIADKKLDITNIDEPSESFDIVICYHILEHIENDIKAISELGRVMKKNGKCFIQTPFREGEIYENPLITDPKERAIHFGQSDHLRIYSLTGLCKRIENCGYKTEVLSFTINEFNGMNENEKVILVKK